MAKPVSEEELQLKKRARRRLIGAIVLVATVAAVLPMVLDSEPKPTSREINIRIPSPDAKGGFADKVAPVTPPAAKGAAENKSDVATVPPAAPETAAVPSLPAAPAAETPAPKAVAEKAPAKAGKAAEKSDKAGKADTVEKAAASKPGPGTFFIQVVALAEPDKAKAMQQKIIDAGVRSYTEVVAAGNGKVTRVRAGPFATREEAERARAQLATVGLEGKVAGQ